MKPRHSFPAPDPANGCAGTTVHPPNGRLNDLATPQLTPPINDHLADGGPPAERALAPVRVALIGSHRLRRECLIDHVLAYHVHNEVLLERNTMHGIAAIPCARRYLPPTMLSDAELARQRGRMRNAVTSGTQGFIPTSELPVVPTAIRLVNPTGTFAPVNILQARTRKRPSAAASCLMVPHLAQLSRLSQRKANELSTHSPGTNESTGKVHPRNIIRKTGVVNRAQAIAQARHGWMNAGPPGTSE